MRRLYVQQKFQDKSLVIIEKAIEICRDYEAQGYNLTLRQLYYQFVARDLLPNNTKSYNRLGTIINDARMAGLLDWDYIVDRTRDLESLPHWDDPQDILDAIAPQFLTPKWDSQPFYVEAWIEKDALIGVLEQACRPLDIPYFSCRGYTSQSEMWSAAQRLRGKIAEGKQVVILHLGDHDPSGMDMSRDIRDRLTTFVTQDWIDFNWAGARPANGSYHNRMIFDNMAEFINEVGPEGEVEGRDVFEMRRIALTMDQIDEYQPPPNPAKLTDSRSEGYIAEFGDESWELDALDPATLTALIREHVFELRDEDQWTAAVEREEEMRTDLESVRDNWDAVKDFLETI